MSEKDGEKTGGKVDNTNQGFGSNDFLNGKTVSKSQGPKIPEGYEKTKTTNERKYKTLSQIVSEMGYEWNKVKFDLAKWAGIEDYDPNQGEKNKNQNEEIRKKLLLGNKPELLGKSISKFSVLKQEILNKLAGSKDFKSENVSAYLGNLSDDKTKKLENLPDEKFVGFMREQLTISQGKINDGLSKSENIGNKRRESLIYQTSNVLEVMQFDERIKKYIESAPELKKYEATTAEVDTRFAESVSILPMEQKKSLLENANFVLVQKRQIANTITSKKIDESVEFKALSPEKKEEFEQILVDVYRYNEKVSPELNDIFSPDVKIRIEQREMKVNKVVNPDISNSFSNFFSNSQNVILQSPEFNNYFKDHYINEFVGEDQKDHSYRDNLQKLYPESKKIIQASFLGVAQYAQCFDKEGNIIDEEVNKLPKEQKNLFDEKIKEKLATVDKEFNGNINTLIKEQSVETCLDTLNKCMNIKFDDGTKEDMLKNFDFSSKVNDGLIVDFVGSINGKKINLSYDMKSGSVSYQEYLFKDKETNTFKKNDPTSKSEMPFVQLPKLEDFVSASKSLDYIQDMKSFSDIDQFNASIKDKLNNQVQKNIDIKDARESFEKVMLQDMVMQEVFAFMGYGDMKKLSNIDKAQEPHLYRLYSMIYASISFYSKDELKSFRESIKTLGLQKSRISENYNNLNVSKEVLDRDFDLNQERVFFDLSMNKSISKLYSKKDSEKNTYLGFFECFIKEETKPLLVIDTVKLQNYISKLNSEVNRDVDNVLNWKRNDIFKKNLGRCRDSFDVLAIEKSF